MTARPASGQWALKFKLCFTKKKKMIQHYNITTLTKISNVVEHWKKISNVVQHWKKNQMFQVASDA